MPVTKRFEPELRASDSRGSPRSGGPLTNQSVRVNGLVDNSILQLTVNQRDRWVKHFDHDHHDKYRHV